MVSAFGEERFLHLLSEIAQLEEILRQEAEKVGGRTMSRRNVETYANDQQALCRQNDFIPDSLFREYGVNRGLRDVNGVGVLTGLTNISKIVSFQNVDGKRVPCEGQLFYRGYNIKNLIGSLGPNELLGFRRSPTSSSSATCPPPSSWRSSPASSATAAPCPPTSPGT